MQRQSPQCYGHSFDEASGQYLLPVRVYPEADGSCPLPYNTVDFPPTEPLGPHQTWRINEARSAWEVVDDFRDVMLWDTATGYPVANRLALDERPPVGTTTLPPLPIASGQRLSNRWDAQRGAWELVPDYSHTPIWDKATGNVLPMLPAGVPLPASASDIAPPAGSAPVRFDDAQGIWIGRHEPQLAASEAERE
ncbi:hypothetical protein EN794_039395 [Mesorhizobium sp. M00.F.Ca.ET.151.01.1.1]|nr:hypothetical protein EN842_33805 [bacterium M00.F.Ca.ET.199.01.1.1]TGT02986.1 hypothetical protein EN820_22215 [bacterium M00.F.Ca.ET.177.01.1.1]TGT57922.1 hypothetical protein EN813_035285 [Mesorhizobium sp. M00.F.Ca.ET.170.01.1.1]TGU06835.1 hypothetical protein EN806_33075 [bacterium M00.F.Ca.ET.163.01.1.1]TGU91536.1 hypothetical protein EN794_039395 [Mesorhizobium sp. M00.F.Ca.ET.151.01.1.1]TGV53224.1 hypothetical protein EN784_40920 [bacterium M00.F.Ca.ET.141.01.1.1]